MTTEQMPTSLSLDEPQSRHYGWNVSVMALDIVMFTLGITFINSTTVIPSLVDALTHSEFIVGLSTGLISGAWLLPQMIVATAMTRSPRKKPAMVWAAWISRAGLMLIALAIWLLGERQPTLTLVCVVGGMFLFFVLDAVVSIPWFDLLAKVIPPRRRGRLLGLSQALGSLGGIGIGLLVAYLLSERSPWAFPYNYAMLFVGASIILMIAATGLTLIREPASKLSADQVPSLRQVWAMMPRILAQDKPFVQLINHHSTHKLCVMLQW